MSDLSEVMSLIQTLQTSGLRFYHRLIRTLTLPNNKKPGDPGLILGPDIPPELIAHYAPTYTPVAVIIAEADSTDYEYWAVLVFNANPAVTTTGRGTVNSGVVSDYLIVGGISGFGSDLKFGSLDRTFIEIGSDTVITNSELVMRYHSILASTGLLQVGDGTPVVLGGANDFQVDNISYPRGLIDENHDSGNSAAIGAAETVIFTGAIKTYRNGRAFNARIAAFWASSAAGSNAFVRVRRNNVAGTLLGQINLANLPATTFFDYKLFELQFVNTSGADVTDLLVLTLQSNTAGQTITQGGNVNANRVFQMYDIGSSTNYAGLSF